MCRAEAEEGEKDPKELLRDLEQQIKLARERGSYKALVDVLTLAGVSQAELPLRCGLSCTTDEKGRIVWVMTAAAAKAKEAAAPPPAAPQPH